MDTAPDSTEIVTVRAVRTITDTSKSPLALWIAAIGLLVGLAGIIFASIVYNASDLVWVIGLFGVLVTAALLIAGTMSALGRH